MGERLFVYARMRRDENSASSKYQGHDRQGNVCKRLKMGSLLSFVSPGNC